MINFFLLITGHHASTNIALLPGCGTPGQKEAKHGAGKKVEMRFANAKEFCILFYSPKEGGSIPGLVSVTRSLYNSSHLLPQTSFETGVRQMDRKLTCDKVVISDANYK